MTAQTAPTVASTSINKVVSIEVRVLLARREMSASALAPVLGVTTQAISKKMRGQSGWTLEDLDTLARYFGVDANTLLPNLGKGSISTDPATEAYCAPAGQPRLRLVASNTSARSEPTGDRHLSRPRLAATRSKVTHPPQINTLPA